MKYSLNAKTSLEFTGKTNERKKQQVANCLN